MIYKLYLKIPILKRAGRLSSDCNAKVMQKRDTFIEKIRGREILEGHSSFLY